MPHVVGGSYRDHVAEATRWSVVAEHSQLVLMFGGVPLRNTQVSDGGVARHRLRDLLASCTEKGVRFVNFSPLRTDALSSLDAEWLPPRPGSDTAVMMGLSHTLIREGLHDVGFLNRYTVGFDRVRSYLFGEIDGVVKDADWAGERSGLDPRRIEDLAREMASKRTMICTAAGLQRADFGEQPLWMTVTLAALLGQIGLPGGGYGIGYGVNANVGVMERPFRWGTFPQGINPVSQFIPVAMLSDMLLDPGGRYEYDGRERTFPHVRMVWWAGGNPFHHHQDLNRLRAAFQRPETIVVNEINWTATARHADIVLPCAAPQEREDFCGGHSDNALIPMPRLVDPPGEALTEYEIFQRLERVMTGKSSDQGWRSAEDWLRVMWSETMSAAAEAGARLPGWDEFLAGDVVDLPDPNPRRVFLEAFRADPVANPRQTPSGKLELYSETIAAFGYEDCPGQATWFEPRDASDGKSSSYPLYLLSGQPETRLHSQLDNGAYSLGKKIQGREPVLINPSDAAERGIGDGDVVELFNDRGICLAGARVTEDVAKGAVFLWTGAWYDPDLDAPKSRDRHGNPNVLTHDRRTSRLSQGPAAHSALVQLRRYEGVLPPVTVHDAPPLVARPKFDPGAHS